VVASNLVMYAFDSLCCLLLNKESRMHYFDAEAGASPFLIFF
jgi:hypothetical protein